MDWVSFSFVVLLNITNSNLFQIQFFRIILFLCFYLILPNEHNQLSVLSLKVSRSFLDLF